MMDKERHKMLAKTYTFVLGDQKWSQLGLGVLEPFLVLTALNVEMAIFVGPPLAQIIIEREQVLIIQFDHFILPW
jgi:hypothetical protein